MRVLVVHLLERVDAGLKGDHVGLGGRGVGDGHLGALLLDVVLQDDEPRGEEERRAEEQQGEGVHVPRERHHAAALAQAQREEVDVRERLGDFGGREAERREQRGHEHGVLVAEHLVLRRVRQQVPHGARLGLGEEEREAVEQFALALVAEHEDAAHVGQAVFVLQQQHARADRLGRVVRAERAHVLEVVQFAVVEEDGERLLAARAHHEHVAAGVGTNGVGQRQGRRGAEAEAVSVAVARAVARAGEHVLHARHRRHRARRARQRRGGEVGQADEHRQLGVEQAHRRGHPHPVAQLPEGGRGRLVGLRREREHPDLPLFERRHREERHALGVEVGDHVLGRRHEAVVLARGLLLGHDVQPQLGVDHRRAVGDAREHGVGGDALLALGEQVGELFEEQARPSGGRLGQAREAAGHPGHLRAHLAELAGEEEVAARTGLADLHERVVLVAAREGHRCPGELGRGERRAGAAAAGELADETRALGGALDEHGLHGVRRGGNAEGKIDSARSLHGSREGSKGAKGERGERSAGGRRRVSRAAAGGGVCCWRTRRPSRA